MSEPPASVTEPPRIQVLPADVVNRIAAGEVIQRPCNAVKELIENSLDARSTMIQVNLREGGLKMIQVQDNGHGIQPTDLPILCERFTTSKLKEFEDLSHLVTFGFRGEALASLSYVARLSVTTRPAGRSCAYRAEYSEGKLTAAPRVCAGNPGTSIHAEDLFRNVPIRRDALKSPREEFVRIAEIVARYSLHYAGKCGFFLRSLDRRTGVGASPTPIGGDLRTTKDWTKVDVVRAAFGQRAAADLLPISHDQHFDVSSVRLAVDRLGLKFEGLLSNPSQVTSEGSPSIQLVLFVNNRLVECASIKRAVEAAYAALLPHRAAQLCIGQARASAASSAASLFVYLSLELPTTSLDVNVHPTKAQVHFLHEDEVITCVRDAIEHFLLRSSGSRSLSIHSLSLKDVGCTREPSSTPPSSLPKQSRLEPFSQRPGGCVSSASPICRPERLVRTDVRAQRLEAFLNRPQPLAEKPRPPSPDVESDSGDDNSVSADSPHRTRDKFHASTPRAESTSSQNTTSEDNYLQTSDSVKSPDVISRLNMSKTGKLAGNKRRPVLLESVLTMREAIEARASVDARSLLRECVFVGCVSRSNCLVQQSTNLLLMRLHPLVKELFYQLLVANFANHGEMVLNPSAPVGTLLNLGLRRAMPDSSPAEVTAFADKGCSILSKRANMLWDYFSLKLQPDEHGILHLHSLPVLLDRFIPNLNHLPTFLTRLVREVNWNEEGACFEGICRTTASFYAKRIKDTVRLKPLLDKNCDLTIANSPGSSADGSEIDEAKTPTCEGAAPWSWTVEHVLLPTIRTVLLPTHTMCFPTKDEKSPALLKLTSLPDLYKVFERC
uniref:DNA_mis_repair domain-containing protein n=1 Tax=Mesocestoides corti TaxID=53468 RepID=A0A5K3F3E6_MESCO